MKDILDAWNINKDDYPGNRTMREKIKFFIGYAVLAPSGHNTQPWIFEILNGGVKLYADRKRALPVIDPNDRELTISCGAALANFIVAANYFGYKTEIKLMPEVNNKDLLAYVTLTQGFPENKENSALFHSITLRHTNRKPFDRRNIDGLVLQKMETIASEEKINFKIIRENHLREVAVRIIEEGDLAQSKDIGFCRELARWVHPDRVKSKDGIPVHSFGKEGIFTHSGPFYYTSMEWGDLQAARDRNLADGSPLLGLIESKTDSEEDWLRSGIGLEKILLFAASEKLSASYLNQPLEIPALKEKFITTLKLKGIPQQILRMGFGKEVRPIPRRDVEDVIK